MKLMPPGHTATIKGDLMIVSGPGFVRWTHALSWRRRLSRKILAAKLMRNLKRTLIAQRLMDDKSPDPE
jgi:hypothetical protein